MTDDVESIDEQTAETKATAAEKLEAAREKFGRVTQSVENKLQGARSTAGRAGEQIRHGAERASEVARETYDSTRDNVRQGYDRVSKDLGHLSQDVNEYVRHNPAKAVAIAAAAGFFVGLLFRGRRD